MLPYIIPRSRCSHKDLDYFICGICSNLARNYLIHHGNCETICCKRAFCASCLDTVTRNHEMPGKQGVSRIVCPTENCNMPLEQPMLRSPSAEEDGVYKQIRVKCLNCPMSFDPIEYGVHIASCVAPNLFEKAEEKGNTFEFELVNPFRIPAGRQILISSPMDDDNELTYGDLMKTSKTTDMNIFYNNRMHQVKVDHTIEFYQMMEEIKKQLGATDDLTLVSMRHKSLEQCGSVEKFLENITDHTQFHCIPPGEEFSDPNGYLYFAKK